MVWQLAACELHAIMQLVTIEVCATRILPAAGPAEWHSAIANPAPKIERAIAPQRMMHGEHHSAGRRAGECAGAVAKLTV